MSEFFIEDEKVRVEFDDGNWVDLKSELTQEDQDYISNAMMKYKDKGIDVTLGRMPLLERMVVAWSFPVQVTRKNISNLRRKYREPVLDKSEELNKDSRAYLEKNSETASSDQPPSDS
jgi:hypothetical protein